MGWRGSAAQRSEGLVEMRCALCPTVVLPSLSACVYMGKGSTSKGTRATFALFFTTALRTNATSFTTFITTLKVIFLHHFVVIFFS